MRALLFALGAVPLIGCHTLKPSGPLTPQTASTGATAKADPTPPPAVKPTPPTMRVTPGDVTDATAREAADKLASELSADSKPSANMPVTVEVSRIKGRLK